MCRSIDRRSFRPAFSRDGRLAYVTQESGQGFSVWVMDAAGRLAEPLLPGRRGSSPQWTDDGTLVIRDESSGGSTFSSVDVATRRLTPFPVDGKGKAEVRVSPRGDAIVFHEISADGTLNLWTQTVTAGTRRQISFDREAISYAVWAPDGNRIAAELKRGRDTHVIVLPAAGGPAEQLTDQPGQSWPGSWSPDGEWVAFAGERAAVWNLWAVSSRTRETRQLTHFTSSDGYVRWPAWSPSGDRVVFERNRQRGSIWMATIK